MQRPFAWIAVVAAVIALLSALLPWHTIEVSSLVLPLDTTATAHRLTHRGTECGLHGKWLIGLGGLAAIGAGCVALGQGCRMPCSPCRVMIVVALLLAVGALLVVIDLFRDSTHCFELPGEVVESDERENGFFIALLASVIGAMSAGLACLVRRQPPEDSGEGLRDGPV